MNKTELNEYIKNGRLDEMLQKITCGKDVQEERKRYLNLLDEAVKLYGDGDWHFISSPGRSEIGGNHTDHQHGHVLACALNIDNLIIVKKRDDNKVTFKDKSFVIEDLDLNDLSFHQEEVNTTNALIRGIAYRLVELGYKVGGYYGLCDSRVLVGSGISSSACFEVMTVEVFNSLYNNKAIKPVDRAIISQYAENKYFGKPCGLMDQMAISVGGFTAIDFFDTNNPGIENYSFSFADYGYELVLVNTKGDHADLSDEYAAITSEIKLVANAMGVEVLAQKKEDYFYNNLASIRKEVNNDRAILRSHHFYQEDKKAIEEKKAIERKDIKALLELIKKSGDSSYKYLQNVYPASRTKSQALSIALGLSENVLKDDGACRVHGGGFDGTIQAIVPKDKLEEYKKTISSVFGNDSILMLRVREYGTIEVI